MEVSVFKGFSKIKKKLVLMHETRPSGGAIWREGIKAGTERTPSFNYFFIVVITFCVHFLHVAT